MAPPQALASVVAALLDDYGLYTIEDFADYLDADKSSAALLAARIRSDDFKALLRATVTANAVSFARSTAELQLLGSEFSVIEESEAALRVQTALAAADVVVLEERVSTATAELKSVQQAAERRNRALRSANMELAALKVERAAAVQARVEAEQEHVQAAETHRLALLDEQAARRAAERAQAAAELAQAAAEDTLADILAAQTASTVRVEMKDQSTCHYLCDGINLATIGTQTEQSYVSPQRHSAARPPQQPRSSSPPLHHLPPQSLLPPPPPLPQHFQPSNAPLDVPPSAFAPYPPNQSPLGPKVKISYTYVDSD